MKIFKFFLIIMLIVLFACSPDNDENSDQAVTPVAHTLTISYVNNRPEQYKLLFFINDTNGKLISVINPANIPSPINIAFETNSSEYIFSYVNIMGRFNETSDSAIYMTIKTWLNYSAETFASSYSANNSTTDIRYDLEVTNCSENITIYYPGGYNYVNKDGYSMISTLVEKPKLVLIKGQAYAVNRGEEYSVIDFPGDLRIDIGEINWQPVHYKSVYYKPINHFSSGNHMNYIFSDTAISSYTSYFFNGWDLNSENGSFDIRSFPEITEKEMLYTSISDYMNNYWSYRGVFDKVPDIIEFYNTDYTINSSNREQLYIETPADCDAAELTVKFNNSIATWAINFPGGNINIPIIEFPDTLMELVSFNKLDYTLNSLKLEQYKDHFNYTDFASENNRFDFTQIRLYRSVSYSLY